MIKPSNDKGEILEKFPSGSYWLELWGNGIAQDDDENDFVGIRTSFQWNTTKGEYVLDRKFLKDWRANPAEWHLSKPNDMAGTVGSTMVDPLALHLLDAKRDIQDEIRTKGSFWNRLVSDPGLKETDVQELEKSLTALNSQIIEKSDVFTHIQEHLDDLYRGVAANQGAASITPIARHLRDMSRGVDINFATQDAQHFPLSRHGMGTRKRQRPGDFDGTCWRKWKSLYSILATG